jgi:hypothetical protein
MLNRCARNAGNEALASANAAAKQSPAATTGSGRF